MESKDARGADWPQVVAMAWQQGQANMAERLAARRWLQQEAASTLSLCLAGMAGALAYAAPLLSGQGGNALAWGAAAVSVYLALLSAALVGGCLLARSVPAQFNEPKNLLCDQGISLTDLQWSESLALQERIERLRLTVNRTAAWLNVVRALAAALPLVFLAAAWWPWR